MKFKLSDFVELDTKGLLAVNGGYYCNGSSNTTVYSNPYYSGNSGGGNHGGGSYGDTSGKTGGGCGRSTTPKSDDTSGEDTNNDSDTGKKTWTRDNQNGTITEVTENGDGTGEIVTKDKETGEIIGQPQPFGPVSTEDKGDSKPSTETPQTVTVNGSGGGTCNGSSSSSDQVTTTVTTGDAPGGGSHTGGSTGTPAGTTGDNPTNPSNPQTPNKPSDTTADGHLICSNPNDYHCDIIAWNHAVDAGLDPRGEGGTDWNANNKTVDQIYNEHFVGKDVDFDGNQAGKMGYILYDWEGDGEYDHIEFGSISADGLSYSFYNNGGFENGEFYDTRYFENDSNAHADNAGNGVVRFIPLN